MNLDALEIPRKLRVALNAGAPVVALESTIIAHGMPRPVNVRTALEVEGAVHAAGGIPATLGIVEGRIVVGLSREQIEHLGTAPNVMKAGEREIPLAVARQADAATTAGASIAIAAAAGIRVFVTGGIGGVGPDAARDLDISSDLIALADYPVITVCAGAKAFMDIPATLEYLETRRVPVATWKTDEFPRFYSRRSGCRPGWRVEDAAEVAAVYKAKQAIGQPGGILVGVPLPQADALDEDAMEAAIARALEEARGRGIRGAAVTPFVLAAIQEATAGKSLDANVALIRNNARVGAEIAVALAS